MNLCVKMGNVSIKKKNVLIPGFPDPVALIDLTYLIVVRFQCAFSININLHLPMFELL